MTGATQTHPSGREGVGVASGQRGQSGPDLPFSIFEGKKAIPVNVQEGQDKYN